jgi:hypothetical protein
MPSTSSIVNRFTKTFDILSRIKKMIEFGRCGSSDAGTGSAVQSGAIEFIVPSVLQQQPLFLSSRM